MRRKSIEVKVGTVALGGSNPIRIQSMTNTLTADIPATVSQIIQLADAGSELVRFTVKDDADAQAVATIKQQLLNKKCTVPLIGDFHYNGHTLLTKYPECAKALDKYRINPGNVGFGNWHDKNFEIFILQAIKHSKPVRIGVNFGSLDQRVLTKLMDENTKKNLQKSADDIAVDAMVKSAIDSIKLAETYGLTHNKIIVSVKLSKVPLMIKAYTQLAALTDVPLHVGVTEAGLGQKGVITSTAGLSVLLHHGIGDTIRVSLTPAPTSSRKEEVHVAQQILQVNGFRNFMPLVTSCPGCGRTSSVVFQEISEQITDFLRQKMPEWKSKQFNGVENMTVAVMGCVVNGPGESREANIGLSLPGTGEDPASPVFIDGKKTITLSGSNRIDDFKKMIEEYVEKNYSNKQKQ